MNMISNALFKTLEGEVGGEPKSREVGSAFRLCEVLGVPGYRRGMEPGRGSECVGEICFSCEGPEYNRCRLDRVLVPRTYVSSIFTVDTATP